MSLLLPFLPAFIAGALAVLVFHQSALGLLHLVGLTPRTPFVLGGVPPLGVPQLLSLMFWGGVWGLALLPLLRPLGDARCWLRGLVLGALGPTLVSWFIVAPLKGLPLAGGWQPAAMATGLIVNAAWGLGLVALLRLAQRAGIPGG